MLPAIGAVVLALAGWSLAEGELPGVSSSSDTTTTVAGAPGASTDNAAVATNTKDGKTVIAISLKITQTSSDNVDATNAAVAAASCTDCETVAIALEGVLIIGDPSTFDPTNIALALNSNCTNCQTLAAAYQDIVQNDTRVRISGEGRQEIASIRKDLESLRNSGLDITAIWQRVNNDAGKFLAVLQNDIFPVGRPANAGAPASATPTTAAPPTTATTSPATTTTEPAAPTTTTIPTTTTTEPAGP
jgi:putative peptide zinc metalloprotease protein